MKKLVSILCSLAMVAALVPMASAATENALPDAAVAQDLSTNIAVGKPITTEGIGWYTNYPASLMNDGYVGTAESESLEGHTMGTAIATGQGYAQIDLLHRYNLEKVQIVIRNNRPTKESYTSYLKISASNDPTFADGGDTLDEVTTQDSTKINSSGIWTINLDGTKDYRYLRITRTQDFGEFGFSEVRAYAKFDGISVMKDATAAAHYHYHKGTVHESVTAPSNVLDGKLDTFFWSGTNKPSNKFANLQIDLKNPYHVGYIEMVARGSGRSNSEYYMCYAFYGSNNVETISDETIDTTIVGNSGNLAAKSSDYTKIALRFGGANNTAKDEIWGSEANAVFGLATDDTTAYRCITENSTYSPRGIELAELRLYSIAQKVNRVDVADNGVVTINFAGKLAKDTITADTVKVVDAQGNTVAIKNEEITDYSYSFTPVKSGTLTVARDVLNEYAVPMAADYTLDITVPEAEKSLPDVTVEKGAAFTEYEGTPAQTYTGTFTVDKDTNYAVASVVWTVGTATGTAEFDTTISEGTVVTGLIVSAADLSTIPSPSAVTVAAE